MSKKHEYGRCPTCGRKMRYCTCRRRSQWLWPLFVLGLVVAICAAVFLRKSGAPTAPPIEISSQATITACRTVAERLVTTCADTLVSRWGDAEIREGRLYLNYESFDAMGGSAFAVFQLIRVQDGRLVPVMCLNPQTLLGTELADTDKQLIIRHELEHYRQYLAREFPIETYFARNSSVPLERWEVRNMLMSEIPAYRVEAEMADRIGWRPTFPVVCGYLDGGDRGLMDSLVSMYSELPFVAPQAAYLRFVADSLYNAAKPRHPT